MKKEEMFIELLGDKYSREILSRTSSMECSALLLSRELDIPLATVYRKLKFLEDEGLIKHVKTIIQLSGNEEKYYRCAIHDVKVNFHKGILSVNLTMVDYNDKIVRLWKRLTQPGSQDIGQPTLPVSRGLSIR
jgi:predicted transcriptional regulator